jgi:hypothetical protein
MNEISGPVITSTFSFLPLGRRFDLHFVIRNGELKLRGAFIHALQAFPHTAHG